MYSPRIDEKYIPELYRLAKENGEPMTKLVNRIIEKALKERENENKGNIKPHS